MLEEHSLVVTGYCITLVRKIIVITRKGKVNLAAYGQQDN